MPPRCHFWYGQPSAQRRNAHEGSGPPGGGVPGGGGSVSVGPRTGLSFHVRASRYKSRREDRGRGNVRGAASRISPARGAGLKVFSNGFWARTTKPLGRKSNQLASAPEILSLPARRYRDAFAPSVDLPDGSRLELFRPLDCRSAVIYLAGLFHLSCRAMTLEWRREVDGC
jgi:hypothetical protein